MALDFYDLVEMTASARTEYEDSLKEENKKLESEIADLYKSNSKLQDDNAEKISARTAISRKISHRKTGGGWLIFLAIAGAAAAWFGLKEEAMKLLQTLSFIGAGAVFVLGIVVRLSHRKYLGELENANADLSAFDKAQGDYFNQIRQRQAQIEIIPLNLRRMRNSIISSTL